MLPHRHRLTQPREFSIAVREGARASSRHVVVHALMGRDEIGLREPRVGFVVSKAVGDAVRRNEVKRRLRHLVGARLDRLPPSSLVVVRALPAASGAGSEGLARSLDHCLDRVLVAR